jgi:hypothetical protein
MRAQFLSQWMSLVICFCAYHGCTKHQPNNHQSFDRKLFVSSILDTVSHSTQTTRFLFTSKLTCQTCIEDAIETFAGLPTAKEFAIISIGSSQKETEYLNYMYARQGITFLYAHPSLLDTVLVKDRAFASSLVYGVRKYTNGVVRFFDGIPPQDTSTYITSASVVSFLTSE